jgi:hypothetical protein
MEGMTKLESRHPTVRDRTADTRGIVHQSPQIHATERIARRRHKAWPGVAAILFAHVLDRQLASGRPPAAGRMVAARSEYLLSAARWELAQSWLRVLDQARRAPTARNPHAPLCRARILDAEGDVRTMLGALSSGRGVSPRGVAMAGLLLSDGTGPLYNRNCPVNLPAALRVVTSHLEATGPLARAARP